MSDGDGHGTAVSAIAAAGRNGEYQHGVAFGATIVSIRADTPGTCQGGGTLAGCEYTDGALAKGVDMARNAGARVINLSVNGSAAGPQLLAAVDAATKAGIIVVVAAGNDGGTANGGRPGGLAANLVAQAGNGLVVIAGSVGAADANASSGVDLNRLSSFSNRAGDLSGNYLTALGYRVVAPNIGDGYKPYYYSGTSFSAPVISGAVALLAQAFPNLTGEQIVSLLYRTADDLGQAGVDGEFGRGRLNLQRAFQPVGTTVLAGSKEAVSLASNGTLPAAAGDARPAATSTVILDEYSRPFRLDLAQTIGTAERQQGQLARALLSGAEVQQVRLDDARLTLTYAKPSFAERTGAASANRGRAETRFVAARVMKRLDGRTSVAFGLAEGATGLVAGLADLAGGRDEPRAIVPTQADTFLTSRSDSVALRREVGSVALTFAAERGAATNADALQPGRDGYRLVSSTLAGRLGGFGVAVAVSQLSEARTVLGGRVAPALGDSASTTRFVDARIARELGGGWSGGFSYRQGWTAFAGGRGDLDGLAISGELARRDGLVRGDRLSFTLSQPFRIESGGLTLRLPDSYDWRTGAVTYADREMSFVPRGREVAAEASYGLPFGGSWLSLNASVRHEPGHFEAAPADVGASLRFSRAF